MIAIVGGIRDPAPCIANSPRKLLISQRLTVPLVLIGTGFSVAVCSLGKHQRDGGGRNHHSGGGAPLGLIPGQARRNHWRRFWIKP
jgi:hypothetical protein